MRLVVGLLAVLLIGAGGPQGPDNPMIAYQVTVLEMNGLGWRSAHYPQLQPVARQATATVWTASRQTAGKITSLAGRIVSNPRATTFPQARATLFHNATRKLVTEYVRVCDAPTPTGDPAFGPKIEEAREGYSASLQGRKLDQGILTTVHLTDTQITAVHPVSWDNADEPEECCEGACCSMAAGNPKVQVPEVARAEVSGEWLIPNDGALVISLGAHTVADPDGKAVVRERLAIIEASPAAAGRAFSFEPGGSPVTGPARKVADADPSSDEPSLPMPVLATPSRSLPLAVDAEGHAETLPPLPADEAPVTALPGSSEPCASPQARTATATAADPMPWRKSQLRDVDSARTGFQPADAAAPPSPAGAVKSLWFRLPLNRNVEIEVHTTTAPRPSSGSPDRD